MTDVNRLRDELAAMPLPVRGAVVGGVLLGVLGAVVGLVVGLRVYAPTAWAATAEVAVPAALLGALAGLVVGLVLRQARGARPGAVRPGPRVR